MQQILCILILCNFYQISNLDFVSVKIMCSKQSVKIRDFLDLTIYYLYNNITIFISTCNQVEFILLII